MDEDNPLIRERRAKLGELRRIGIDPYGARWEVTALAGGLQEQHRDAPAAALESQRIGVSLAGRLIALRDHGRPAVVQLAVLVEMMRREGFELPVASFGPGPASSPLRSRSSAFWLRPCGRCRRSGTASWMWRRGTASAISICWRTPRS